jgi:hypothetical protein
MVRLEVLHIVTWQTSVSRFSACESHRCLELLRYMERFMLPNLETLEYPWIFSVKSAKQLSMKNRGKQKWCEGNIYVFLSQRDSALSSCSIQGCTLGVLSDPPWHKHKPENTWIFPLNEDDKDWHRYLSAMEGKILFRIVNKYLLIDLCFKHSWSF